MLTDRERWKWRGGRFTILVSSYRPEFESKTSMMKLILLALLFVSAVGDVINGICDFDEVGFADLSGSVIFTQQNPAAVC